MDMSTVIGVVERNADKLAARWLERLRKEAGMEDYAREPAPLLLDHVRGAYQEIGTYLDQPRHQVIAEHFRATGRRRRERGLPLAEVIRAVQLARTVLWQYVIEQGIFDSTVNLYQALNLYRQIVGFFDQAVLYAVEGYFETASGEP